MSVAETNIAETPNVNPADAKLLDWQLAKASPADIVRAARDLVGRERLAVVSSFGTESAALLKVVAEVDPAIPVLFIDTGWLFEETLAYRDTITALLGLTDVRSLTPDVGEIAKRDPERDLWDSNPDACCALRKVEPLAKGLAPFAAWINGRKRYQGGQRTELAAVEADGTRLKFNPFARIERAELEAIAKSSNLPPHPLLAAGFLSVGCMPCTSRAQSGDDDTRAGRWRGRDKVECGIHTMKLS
jgi:phosphoadenosine phosphosulfate reductase